MYISPPFAQNRRLGVRFPPGLPTKSTRVKKT